MKTDAIVIGGGVAGLATGALLAKQGKRVTVLEKGNQPGGRAYTYEDKGFTLNYGPHAMYRPNSGILGDVLRRLERPLPDGHCVDDPRGRGVEVQNRDVIIDNHLGRVLRIDVVRGRNQHQRLVGRQAHALPCS